MKCFSQTRINTSSVKFSEFEFGKTASPDRISGGKISRAFFWKAAHESRLWATGHDLRQIWAATLGKTCHPFKTSVWPAILFGLATWKNFVGIDSFIRIIQVVHEIQFAKFDEPKWYGVKMLGWWGQETSDGVSWIGQVWKHFQWFRSILPTFTNIYHAWTIKCMNDQFQNDFG